MTVSLVNDGPYTVVLDSEALSGPRAGRRPPAGAGADPAGTAHSTAADQPKGD